MSESIVEEAEIPPAADDPQVPRILVIEDDNGIAEILVRALEGSGFNATVTHSGKLGLLFASSGDYDLVILDLLLPDTDGMSLLDQLMETRSRQQVIVVSALGNVDAKVRCLDRGAADYLAKPFALDEFVARVRARLRNSRDATPEASIQDGSLTLDLQRRLASWDDQPIPLSPREFLLLEHLVRHKGDVCTRKDLREAVFGFTFDTGTNVVDVYVRRLRKKLGGRHIETVRNVGYCLPSACFSFLPLLFG